MATVNSKRLDKRRDRRLFMGKTGKTQYHGLLNQGATCYLNSVLQVLFMTPDFRHRVTRNNAKEEHIDKELRDLFMDLEKRDGCTSKITNKLKIKNVHEQRDAAEHYEKILRLTSPEASKIFHGELINKNICKKCHTAIESPAGFWHLPLPLVNDNNDYSVARGIVDFFCSSEISGDDRMYCESCDEKCDAVLDCEVKRHPEVLVLLLKRFEFDYGYMAYVKINQPVTVANALQLSGKSYELYAMVEHFGELRYGHYISTISSQDDTNPKWYRFDDSNVVPHAAPKLERSQSAYLLFYQQQKETPLVNAIHGPEAVNKEQFPDENKVENEEMSVSLKRPGSPEKNQEEHKKKPKQERSGEDLDFGSSSYDVRKERHVNNSNMEVSDHKQHRFKVEPNGQIEQEPEQVFEFEKTEQLSKHTSSEDQSETERYSTGDMMMKTSSENIKSITCDEGLVNEINSNKMQTGRMLHKQEGCSESEVQYGFDGGKSMQATQKELQKSGQVEGCLIKSDLSCEDLQSCPNVRTNRGKWDQPETLAHAKDAGGEDSEAETIDASLKDLDESILDQQTLGNVGKNDEIVNEIDNSTKEDTKSSNRMNALTGPVEEDEEANKSSLLSENSCANEKVDESKTERKINTNVKLMEMDKMEKRLLTKKYLYYLECVKNSQDTDKNTCVSVAHPVPMISTWQTEYCSSGGNKERFRKYLENAEHVDVIREGDQETIKITLKKSKEERS